MSLLSSKNEDVRLEDINANGKSFQNLSKTPNQGPQRLRLKQRSSVDTSVLDQNSNIHNRTLDGFKGTDDYTINNNLNRRNNNAKLVENTIMIEENIKRAQSSHGMFGRNHNKMNL